MRGMERLLDGAVLRKGRNDMIVQAKGLAYDFGGQKR
jgi:hypothetical protein